MRQCPDPLLLKLLYPTSPDIDFSLPVFSQFSLSSPPAFRSGCYGNGSKLIVMLLLVSLL